MRKFKYDFEVDDDFEVGVCYDCILRDWVEHMDDDGYSDGYLYCTIGSNYENCPLEEV